MVIKDLVTISFVMIKINMIMVVVIDLVVIYMPNII